MAQVTVFLFYTHTHTHFTLAHIYKLKIFHTHREIKKFSRSLLNEAHRLKCQISFDQIGFQIEHINSISIFLYSNMT